jgi:hypothetical protein
MMRIESIVTVALLVFLSSHQAHGRRSVSRMLINGDSNFEYVATTDVSFL